jgi:DNA-binding transcriptional ArsR family regulator
MSIVRSLRIPEALLKAVRHVARREHLDESTATRQLIALGATEYAVRLYRDGKMTLREAAELADTTVREMIEILLDHGVKGNVTASQERKAIEFVLSKM